MALYPCTFTIPSGQANSNGAKLTGSGFGSIPSLRTNDQIQVTVTVTGNTPPSTLNGYMIISPYQGATNQTLPSPFKNGSKFVCYKSQMGVTGSQNGQGVTVYTFDALSYGGGYVGQYELTFVAEDPSTSPPTQWSEDPEFDTGE